MDFEDDRELNDAGKDFEHKWPLRGAMKVGDTHQNLDHFIEVSFH